MIRKQIFARVSQPTGEFIKEWRDFTFDGFTKELNAGPGECVLKLGVAFDYQGIDLALGNDLELWVSDNDTVASRSDGFSARLIYKGYISLIERDISGGKEVVAVHMLGYYTRLALDILKNGSQTTLYSISGTGLTTTSGSQTAADIGLMTRTVIDRYRAETTLPKIYYAGNGSLAADDIPDTSTTATYSFQRMTYREALDQLKKMAPAGTYYYIDETGRVKFRTTPTSPTHTFTLGQHFTEVHIEQSLEKVRNFLLVWNGETGAAKVYKHYQDDTSITRYGRRAETDDDYGVDNANAADLIGTKFLAENKDPAAIVRCRIMDSLASAAESISGSGLFGYDIESIQPGETCRFTGFNKDDSYGLSDIFRDNMLITKVSYHLDYVDIEVEVVKSGLQDFQDKQGSEIARIQAGGLSISESYT